MVYNHTLHIKSLTVLHNFYHQIVIGSTKKKIADTHFDMVISFMVNNNFLTQFGLPKML